MALLVEFYFQFPQGKINLVRTFILSLSISSCNYLKSPKPGALHIFFFLIAEDNISGRPKGAWFTMMSNGGPPSVECAPDLNSTHSNFFKNAGVFVRVEREASSKK